jgi:methyl-accepting chemotaxis protein
MRGRRTGHELSAFGIHLLLAALAFALVLALSAGAIMLVRWVLPLELASSSPQKALEASGRILELHERFWPVTLVSLIGVALAAGWLGRRITGPLVRFTQAFQQIADGRLPDSLQIRSTDYLALEVAAFNSMVAALRARATEQERARAEVISALEALSDHAAKSEDDVLSALAARALERVRSSGGRVS